MPSATPLAYQRAPQCIVMDLLPASRSGVHEFQRKRRELRPAKACQKQTFMLTSSEDEQYLLSAMVCDVSKSLDARIYYLQHVKICQ